MQYATCMPFHLKVLSSGEILNDFNFNLINSDNVSMSSQNFQISSVCRISYRFI